MMERREFIALLGGAAAWPVTTWAQQPEHVRRVGVLIALTENDPEGQLRAQAFRQGLQQLGWIEGRNLHIDYRWPGAEVAFGVLRDPNPATRVKRGQHLPNPNGEAAN